MELTDWVQPGIVVTGVGGAVGFLLRSLRGMETRLDQRINEVEAEMKDLKAEMKDMEKRQADNLKDLKADMEKT